jgi:hypothetical protein
MENLTADEIKLVVEALLFTGSVQVFSEHTDEQSKKMVEIAKKLYSKNPTELKGIYFLVEHAYEEEYASDILTAFPNIPQADIKSLMGP